MFIRALTVLLLFLNLGVAAWWLAQPAPAAHTPAVQVPGVPLLELASSAAAAAAAPVTPAPAPPSAAQTAAVQDPVVTPAPAPVQAPPPAATSAHVPPPAPDPVPPPAPKPPAEALVCAELGPFDDETAAHGALASVRPAGKQARVLSRQPAAKGYSVVLPAAGDRDAARALADRVGKAGLGDHFIINTGENANGVALGHYTSQDGAQRRLEQVQAAGFATARIAASGSGQPSWWARLQLPAAQAESLHARRCATAQG